jgi:hypothetical protein
MWCTKHIKMRDREWTRGEHGKKVEALKRDENEHKNRDTLSLLKKEVKYIL